MSLCKLLRWFSPGTSASSTTKSGRHDIAEILLKVALKCQKLKKIIKNQTTCYQRLNIIWLFNVLTMSLVPETNLAN
jgi:hypothetical protein